MTKPLSPTMKRNRRTHRAYVKAVTALHTPRFRVGGFPRLFTLADAKQCAEEVFRRSGVVASIEQV